MDTDTIKTLLDFGEIEVKSVEISQQKIMVSCHSNPEEPVYPGCLGKCKKVKSEQVRPVRNMPMSGKQVYLGLRDRKFHCEKCSRYFHEQFSFARQNIFSA